MWPVRVHVALVLLLAGCGAGGPADTADRRAAAKAPPPSAIVAAESLPTVTRPAVELADHVSADAPGWQYVIEQDPARQAARVVAVLVSEPFTDRIGASDRLRLTVLEGNGREDRGRPAVSLDFADTLNACRETVCPITLQTDLTPLENANLISLRSDRTGALTRDKGREDIAALLTRAHQVLLAVDIDGEGRRVVRFTAAGPLRLPLPHPSAG